ncbi:MAG: hypothetical protein JWQ65_815 [Devosia sp.]|nr:hypothetical protein [Devosia sp.]
MPSAPRPTVFVDFHGTICNDRYWRSLSNEQQQPLQAFLFQKNSHLVDEWMRGFHTAEAINEMIAAALGLPYDVVWTTFIADCRSMNVSPAILARLRLLRPVETGMMERAPHEAIRKQPLCKRTALVAAFGRHGEHLFALTSQENRFAADNATDHAPIWQVNVRYARSQIQW